MKRERFFMLLSISILVISSIVIAHRNNAIHGLTQENLLLLDEVEDLNIELGLIQEEVLEMVSVTSGLNNTLNALIDSLNEQEAIAQNTYAWVIDTKEIIAYSFQGSLNYTFSVNYSFPEPTMTVFTILDSDRETVLGYTRMVLDGIGIQIVTIEIPLPEETLTWIIFPSVHWIEDDVPVFDRNWCSEASIEVLEGSSGHIKGSCGEQSAACHNYSN